MKVIISNDLNTLYAKPDYALGELGILDGKIATGVSSINLVNADGFATDDYILIGEIGGERSEIAQVQSVSSQTLTLTGALSFAHDNKSKVYKLKYNQVKFYEDDTVLATTTLKSDYFTAESQSISSEKDYSISFYNSTSATESPRGEEIAGTENLLCTVGDLLQYESSELLGRKILDKIDIATREIRAKFITQEQTITDLSTRNKERLRTPTALLALYYLFVELIKKADDTPTLKARKYLAMYKEKITEVGDIINVGDDDVKLFGQTLATR